MTGRQEESLARLDHHLGRLLVTGVSVSAILLVLGLVALVAMPGAGVSHGLLTGGLFVLMATPMLRVVVSFVEYVRMRDWFFATTTIVVMLELMVTVIVALTRR